MNRAQQLRNALVAIFNGGITLIILLIAPLGLAAVIVNTLLITASTYIVACLADWVVVWLLPYSQTELLSESNPKQSNLQRVAKTLLQERRRR